ncbi:uncharacterized protein LOC117640496 [Thrips palmi]|uniref:Uncharacterized protein LOC117640496 n=1 Tax=Thrips palmi TaxID=161013 RepID=A0A6P8Y8D0_THRPL|nr:uncharacterized protein LOC117640496 [Thrips palmi]
MEDKPRPNFTSSVSIAVPGPGRPGQDEVDRAMPAMPNHGHDNAAFDADEAVTISVPEDGASGPLNGSMTSTASTVTADGTPTKTAKDGMAEAVKPGAGQHEPDSAEDVRDPYDEYFVPVNEHRKCMSPSHVTMSVFGKMARDTN